MSKRSKTLTPTAHEIYFIPESYREAGIHRFIFAFELRDLSARLELFGLNHIDLLLHGLLAWAAGHTHSHHHYGTSSRNPCRFSFHFGVSSNLL